MPKDATSRTTSPARRRLPLLIIPVVALAGIFLLRDHLTFEALRDNRDALLAIRDANYALAVVGFVGAYVAIVAFSLPGASVATLTGGFLFGVMPGFVLNVIGAGTGAVLIFLAVRHGLGDRLTRRFDTGSERARKVMQGLRENELSVLFLMRLLPALPFFMVNVVAALGGARLSLFMLTTYLGIMPGTLIYTWIGSGLADVFARGEAPDLSIMLEPHVLGPIAALCVLAALPIVIRAMRKGKTP